MDIWDRMTLCASGSDRIYCEAIIAETAACSKDKRFFCFINPESIRGIKMKKLYFGIHRAILLPSGESNTDEPIRNVTKEAV